MGNYLINQVQAEYSYASQSLVDPVSSSSQKDPSITHSTPGHSSGGENAGVAGTQVPGKSSQHQYKRKMKKSNVVILMNVTQEVYTGLLEDLKRILPPL
jgi:hypothetical protein